MKRLMVIALAALSLVSTAQLAAAAPGGGGVIGDIRDADGRGDWDRRDDRDDRGGWDRDDRGGWDRDDRGGWDRGGRGGRDDRGGRGGRDDDRGGYGRVTLTRYYSVSRADHWITPYAPNDRSYNYETDLGYLLTSPARGFQPLYECLVRGTDHMLSLDRNCERQQYLGIAGYIRVNRAPGARELYRCLTQDGRSHFASFDRYCEGQRREGVLGNIDQY